MRRVTLSVYGLLLAGEVLWSAIFPLGPYYHDRLGLNTTETATIFAAAGITILVVSLPAGVVADRLGARRLSLLAGTLLAASALGNAVAHDLWSLLASRAAFGVAFGALWPASLSYLTALLPAERRARPLSMSIAVAGLGSTIGPVFGGILTERFGIGLPFGALAAVAALLTIALATCPPVASGSRIEHPPLVRSLRRLSRSRLAVAGLVFMGVPALASHTIHLLVPLRLHERGISDGAIGYGLSASAVVFMLGSLAATSLGERAARLRTGGGALLVLGAIFLIPIVSGAVVPLFVFLVVRAIPLAALYTIAVPIAVRGAERVGVGSGAILGLSNAIWAMSAFVGPVAAGILDDHVGDRATWVADCAIVVVVGCLALRSAARESE